MGSGSHTQEFPSGTEEELQQRLSLAGPEDVVRGLFINSTLEMAQQHGDESLMRQCLEVGGEERFLEFFNYPLSTWLRIAYVVARGLSNQFGGFDGAMREMGYRASRDFYVSSAGRVLLLLARNEPLRLLSNMPSTTLVVLGDTGISEMKRTSNNSAVLVYKGDLTPRPYNEGALRAALEAMNAKDVVVQTRPTALFDTEYELSWK